MKRNGTEFFRPHSQPAQMLYDTLVKESHLRALRTVDEWIKSERQVVWSAALKYALRNNLNRPTIEQIELAEHQAIGHSDYAAKYAYAVSDILVKT